MHERNLEQEGALAQEGHHCIIQAVAGSQEESLRMGALPIRAAFAPQLHPLGRLPGLVQPVMQPQLQAHLLQEGQEQ
jgi:hypothetical protein